MYVDKHFTFDAGKIVSFLHEFTFLLLHKYN
jgi:hypothetical protein